MNNLFKHSKRFFNRNASTILTYVGSAGVIVTTVLAVKATPKAVRLIDHAEEEKGEKLTKLETVRIAGPAYIPTIMTGVTTIACIFGANVLNKRQQAALMSAYAFLDNSYKEYKNKVQELYGEDANTLIRESIAKDKYEEGNKPEDGKELFYDEFSGRYFHANKNVVTNAEFQLNRDLQRHGGVYLNEYFEVLGLPETDYGDYLGWSTYYISEISWDGEWLDFEVQKVVIEEDGLECNVISMVIDPVPDFYEY